METDRNVGKKKSQKTDRNVGKLEKTDCNIGKRVLSFVIMSGRGGRSSGRGGRGRGRGQNYTGASKASKSGLCTTLGNNVFDYGHKAAADQMRTSWEKIVQYVGTTYGQDICNELQNKTTVTLAEPIHTPTVLARHAIREQMIHTGQENIQQVA